MADEEHNYDDEVSEELNEDEEIDYDEEVENLENEGDVPATATITVKVVKPEDRVTSNMLTKFELATVIGMRATQISNGDDYFIDQDPLLTDPIQIAERELISNNCPLIIEREIDRIGNIRMVEHWKVREMLINFKD